MYCPKCRQEYREGFTVCKDCNEVLVNELPGEMKKQHTKGLSLNSLLNNHVEKYLKIGGIIYIFIGLLNDIVKSIESIASSNNHFSIVGTGLIFGAINLCFSALSTILWGFFYFWLGKILEILKAGFKNE